VRFGTWARGVASELGPTVALAWPVVLAEFGWMGMFVVDTMIVGRLGVEAIGAVSLGTMAFFTPIVFGMGLLLGLDTMVSQAFGAGDMDGARRSLAQGVILAVALTPPLMLVVLAMPPVLAAIGVDPGVLRRARPYLEVTVWGTLPLLVYAAFRRYLQAVGRVGPVLFALVSANVVNAAGNWLLVFGRLGLPALGVTGSGWATTISRLYMAGVLVFAAWHHDRRHGIPGGSDLSRWRPDPARLRRLLTLGLPAAGHVTLESGVFAAATALAGRLGPVSLAASQVVLNVACVTFMIPLGLASAGAVRVGQAVGRGDTPAAARVGWATLGLGTAFMGLAGLTFAAAPRAIVAAFTDDPRVLRLGVPLLLLAATFQLFDGVQGVTTGNLRGAGDTHTPMVSHALAHWVIGLPLGYVLAFPAGFGVVGLWAGLSLGVILAACLLFTAWLAKARELTGSAS
jgi:MATE family multidrug resistance protein